MSHVIAFERSQSVSNSNGTPSQRFAEYTEEMTDQVNNNTIATGTGSPEGVLKASFPKLYADSAGTTGSILYIKKTGSGNTGWILV